MKRSSMTIAAAVLSLSVSAMAQHGHGSMAMGSSMGHHSNMASTHSSHSSSMHGQRTMDQKLSANTQLSSKISTLTGMSAQDACSGFKNLGQCVAAAHVSKNLNIPFSNLKDTMLALNADGTANTAAKPMSLGKAIQTLAPQADSSSEVKKANQQAKQDG